MQCITLKIDGNLGEMDARAASDGLGALIDILRSIDHEDTAIVRLRDLRAGSAVMTVEAPDDLVESVVDGLGVLTDERILPRGWNQKTIEGVKALVRVNRRDGVKGLAVSGLDRRHLVDEELSRLADEVRASQPQALGTITGLLHGYNRPKSEPPHGRIRDESTGASVRIDLANDLVSKVLPLLDKRVIVRGIVRYDPWTGAIDRILLRGIEPAPVLSKSPVSSGVGILKSLFPPDADSVSLIREVRDAQ
nr:hypothetical protein [Pseudoclavibacter sp. Marseille-Q3772]